MSDVPVDGRDLDPELEEQLVLAEIVSHVLDRGVVIAGEVTISVAGIDLIELGLNLYLCSTEAAVRAGISGSDVPKKAVFPRPDPRTPGRDPEGPAPPDRT